MHLTICNCLCAYEFLYSAILMKPILMNEYFNICIYLYVYLLKHTNTDVRAHPHTHANTFVHKSLYRPMFVCMC